MTDSLPPGQRRPPDSDDGDLAGWDADPAPQGTRDAGPAHDDEAHEEQPGFPDGPASPAEGGD